MQDSTQLLRKGERPNPLEGVEIFFQWRSNVILKDLYGEYKGDITAEFSEHCVWTELY